MTQAEAKDQDAASKRSRWLLAGVVLSLVYVCALLWIASQRDGLDYFWGRLIETGPNELGDFLAGAFAPLAFLWLVIAVLVQAQELRAQRQELALTRREFQDNRKVLTATQAELAAQAAASAQTAEFMGRQAGILQLQLDAQRLDRSDEHTERLLNQVNAMMSAGLYDAMEFYWSGFGWKHLYKLSTSVDRDTRISRMGSGLVQEVASFSGLQTLRAMRFRPDSRPKVEEFKQLLENVLTASGDASPGMAYIMDALHIHDMAGVVQRLLEEAKWTLDE